MDVTYGRPPGRPGRGTPTRPHRGSFGPAILTHNNSRGYVMHVYCVAIEIQPLFCKSIFIWEYVSMYNL
jgi:hypothetical protein